MKFTLPFVCRNLMNVRHHWSVPGRIQQRCAGYVLAAIGKDAGNVGRRRVVITLHRNPAHALDRDGAYSSVKPLLDAIKNLGHLTDDSEKWCDFQVDDKRRKTTVEIEECDE